MASESSFPSGAGTRSKAAAVIARLDRIPIWSLSYLFIGIIGIGVRRSFLVVHPQRQPTTSVFLSN